jgi:hypothetical protein
VEARAARRPARLGRTMMADRAVAPGSVEAMLAWAFAPMHKRALGLAVGLTLAIIAFLVTAFHVVAQPDDGPSIGLLAQYFYGYSPTWAGACVGAWWAFVMGFVAGWFGAFVRNFALALWLMGIRIKANLAETRDFLDHI